MVSGATQNPKPLKKEDAAAGWVLEARICLTLPQAMGLNIWRLYRVCRVSPYGLVLGNRQIGLRKPQGLPTHLGPFGRSHPCDLVRRFVEGRHKQTPATNVDVIRHQVRGKHCTWWLRS